MNINSISAKLSQPEFLIMGKLSAVIVTETKLCESCCSPELSFMISFIPSFKVILLHTDRIELVIKEEFLFISRTIFQENV